MDKKKWKKLKVKVGEGKVDLKAQLEKVKIEPEELGQVSGATGMQISEYKEKIQQALGEEFDEDE